MNDQVLNIPEEFWNKTLLVNSRRKFERWLRNPDNDECVYFILSVDTKKAQGEKMLSNREIVELQKAGFQQVRIGLNCILY